MISTAPPGDREINDVIISMAIEGMAHHRLFFIIGLVMNSNLLIG